MELLVVHSPSDQLEIASTNRQSRPQRSVGGFLTKQSYTQPDDRVFVKSCLLLRAAVLLTDYSSRDPPEPNSRQMLLWVRCVPVCTASRAQSNQTLFEQTAKAKPTRFLDLHAAFTRLRSTMALSSALDIGALSSLLTTAQEAEVHEAHKTN